MNNIESFGEGVDGRRGIVGVGEGCVYFSD